MWLSGVWRAGARDPPQNIFEMLTGYVKPFTVHVHTNANEGSDNPAEVNNRGFCLKYVQQPCTSTIS